MTTQQRVGGIIQVAANGVMYNAKGNFTWNLGNPKREAVLGADRPHGFKETPQVAFVEGEVTDAGDLDVNALTTMEAATVTVRLANKKVVVLRNAWFAADGTGNTDEGNIAVRWESAARGEEFAA